MDDLKQTIEEYVECKAFIKEATERMNELGERIKAASNIDDVYDLDVATVSCVPGRVSYRYSEDLQAREKAVKDDQKTEIKTGVAEAVAGDPYLVVKFKKQ